MAKLGNFKLEKAKILLGAANAKPERPRIKEQLELENSLLNTQKALTADDKKIDNEMYGELSEKWKGKGGGNGGDALISGLTAGLKKGSFLEDKERYKKVMQFTEKMKGMVESQNEQLFQEEQLSNARNSVTPRIMAYLDSYKNMSPNDRKVYLQNTIEEYNNVAGTDYKIVDATGSEPWKVIVSDGMELAPLDFMEFIKMPDEKRAAYYLNSNEVKSYENELAQEDSLNRQILENKARYSKYKADEKSPVNAQERKKQLAESGQLPEGAILFDELKGPEFKQRLEDLKIEREKGKPAELGIEALNEMEKIFKNHPNISTSLAKWALSKNPGPWSNILRNASSQDDIDALLELEKHAGTLNLGTLSQFKGQRPTDVLKKLIASTNPGSNFTYKAFIPIKELYQKRFEEQIEKSNEAERGFDNRYFPSYSKNKNAPTKSAEPAGQNKIDMSEVENKLKAIPGLTQADIDEALKRVSSGQ